MTARAADFGAVVSVFSFQDAHITSVKDYPSMAAAEGEALEDHAGHRPIGGGAPCVAAMAAATAWLIQAVLSGAAPLLCRPTARSR